MNNSAPKPPLTGLARQLVSDQLLTEQQAVDAKQQSESTNTPLVSYLVNKLSINSKPLAHIISREFGVPLLDLSVFDPQYIAKDLIDDKLIHKHHILPLYVRGNRLFVAISDPARVDTLDDIKFHTNMPVEFILVEENKLTKAIDTYLDSNDKVLKELGDGDLDNLEIGQQEDGQDSDTSQGDDAPVVRFVNKILLDAIKKHASDVHFEPYEKAYRIRYRIDGVLSEVAAPPSNLANRLASRLKVMAQLDISERRIPQDGRIKLKVSRTRSIDFRVSTLPTLWGEKVVLRLLDSSSARIGIEALGFEDDQREAYEKALNKPQGMILVTGPTGGGKTVTLYTGLNILNTLERNISTAEDPVEINMMGVNQVHVNYKVGLDFATALRSFLRQDPDVVMVGEIRDLETAEIAIKAAQTGHLVLSTVHTNSAAETLTRLHNMGIPSFNIATSVTLIIAQRLARRLCTSCRTKTDIPKQSLLELGFTEEMLLNSNIYSAGKGCEHCHKGYKGRVGIYEVVPITEDIARLILADGNAMDIDDQARKEGFISLRTAALKKVAAGITSLEEINRVTKE